MGIDLVLFRKLVALSAKMDAPQRSLMLGRQTLTYSGKGGRLYDLALRRSGFAGVTIGACVGPDQYAEPCLKAIGLGDVEALDFSAFEGADHIHDLNEPIPETLHGQFDFIFDGGTIEHVFNVPQALTNVFHMLRPGGVFASANGMNGWWGHGLYQFGADLVYSFWKRQAGCEVMQCEAVPKLHTHAPIGLRDPATRGKRLRGLGNKLPDGRIYLYYEIRKPDGAVLRGPALQSDYAVRWEKDGMNAAQEEQA